MQEKISIFSFFSGIGILDLAFEKNGYNIVFVNEYDNLFIESYRYARMQMNLRAPIYGYRNDSAERYARRRGKKNLLALIAQEREKGNLVGFIGGPPCPDFSVAGKNAGVDGENGRLTKIYFDIICRCHPDFFLFENVKGLVKTEKHRAFYKEMMMKVQANDYVIAENILNALAYGVPQFRERVFMVGIHKKIYQNEPNTIVLHPHSSSRCDRASSPIYSINFRFGHSFFRFFFGTNRPKVNAQTYFILSASSWNLNRGTEGA